MTEIIKIRVLDLKRGILSQSRPVRYSPGQDFVLFFRRIIPELPKRGEICCFVNSYGQPIQRLGPDAFPPAAFWHVGIVTNSENCLENKESLFSNCGDLSEDVRKFLYDDLHSNVFETPFQSFEAAPLSIPLKELFHGYAQIISFNDLDEGRFELKYHNEKAVFRVTISFQQGETGKGPFQKDEIELLKDVASLDLPFEIEHINKAFETYRGIHVEHQLGDGSVELKTFAPAGSPSDEQERQLKFKDSGNRVDPMGLLADGDAPLSRQMLIEREGFTKGSKLGRDILERITGEICDIFQAGPNDIYILSYEEPEATIWHSTLEKRIPDRDDLLHFRSEERPGSFVWIGDVDSFFVSKSGSNRLYLFSPSSEKRELTDISRVFSTYQNNKRLQTKFEAYGEVRDLFVGRTRNIIYLVVAQADRIEFFNIRPY